MEVKIVPALSMMMLLVLDVAKGAEVGTWTQWTDWSECSLTCGSGLSSRTRYWEQPKGEPKFENPFTMTDNEECNEGSCPIDGSWYMWGRWSMCSEACGGGTQVRKRKCNKPMNGGKPCDGEDYEETECNSISCPPLPVRFNLAVCNSSKYFMCSSRRMCIPKGELCDDTVQCHDGSDEKRCYDVDRGGKVKYSYVRDAGAENRVSLTVITSFVLTAILTSFIG